MNGILTGIGILLFVVGLIMGIISGIGMVVSHPGPTANIPSYGVDAVVAIVFMIIGALMAVFGIRRF